jgi:cardiolipin synthase (CMP-forming)
VNGILRHLPNALTATRVVAAPAIAFLLLRSQFEAAFAVFVLAGLSDAVDGYLAKRLAPGSRVGVYLDPAADKVLMLLSFLTLTKLGVTPLWLTLIVIARDAAIIVGIAAARSLGLSIHVAPLPIGKASTAIQVGYVGMLLFLLAFNIEAEGLRVVAGFATAILTLASAFAYGQVWLKAFALRRRTA